MVVVAVMVGVGPSSQADLVARLDGVQDSRTAARQVEVSVLREGRMVDLDEVAVFRQVNVS